MVVAIGFGGARGEVDSRSFRASQATPLIGVTENLQISVHAYSFWPPFLLGFCAGGMAFFQPVGFRGGHGHAMWIVE